MATDLPTTIDRLYRVGFACGHQVVVGTLPDPPPQMIGRVNGCPVCGAEREVRTCGPIWWGG